MKRFWLILLLLAACGASQAQLGIGKWRDHLSYASLYQVVKADGCVYGVAGGGLYRCDLANGAITRVNKTTDLNDVGISHVAYDQASRCLVVAYNNANIDLLVGDEVYNVSDIKRNEIPGSKTIHSITFSGGCAYLACGFGIVVVDLSRHEIKETYYIGEDGTYMNVNDIAFTVDSIYAATDDGLMSAAKNNPYLNIVSNWRHDESTLLAGQRIVSLSVDSAQRLYATVRNEGDSASTLYQQLPGLQFAPWLSGDIHSVKSGVEMGLGNGRMLVVRDNSIEIYDAGYQLRQRVGTVGWLSMEANDAVLTADGHLWVAHDWSGLAEMGLDDPEATLALHNLQGPASDNVYRLVSFNDDLRVCPGGHTSTYMGTYLPGNVYTYNKNNWSRLDNSNGMRSRLMDIVDVAVNPLNGKTAMAAAWGYGIAEIRDNQVVEIYDATNTDGALVAYQSGGYSTLRTGGVAYDLNGDLWVTNSLQTNGLAVRRSNGSWSSFNTLTLTAGAEIDHILCDSIYGYKLFWGRANRIFVHDGAERSAYINANHGSKLTTSSVNCVVQDHNGNLWMGTNKGIKVIYDLYRAFQDGGHGEEAPVSCSNIVFSQNGINEYLMAYESITCIAVDGANRKWVGTASGGLYLLSPTGLEELEHFTASNSPLFSDKVVSISILPWTGEVFVGTDKGLQSYRGTATFAFSEPQSEIHAFPNPVRPDYDGPIAITGFTRNAIVHITDAAGHTVFSTKANGGQAVWNGRTNSGERVASGVYYVFASADDGTMRSVAKVLVVR